MSDRVAAVLAEYNKNRDDFLLDMAVKVGGGEVSLKIIH